MSRFEKAARLRGLGWGNAGTSRPGSAAGLWMLWRAARRPHAVWSGSRFAGALLMGWGGFNIVEGLIDHILLGVHHVNERAPVWQWPYWDWGLIVISAAIFLLGYALGAPGRRRLPSAAA